MAREIPSKALGFNVNQFVRNASDRSHHFSMLKNPSTVPITVC